MSVRIGMWSIKLAKELTSRGVSVWLDRTDIDPGAGWRDAIKKSIESGNFFLACFSWEYNDCERHRRRRL
jgi:hypothetical protein